MTTPSVQPPTGLWREKWESGAAAGTAARAWFKGQLVIAHPKAFLSLLRQRIILTLRYLFRIPIDDIREQEFRILARHMKNLAQHNVQLLQLVNNLAGRLAYYEQGPLQESHQEYLNNLEVGILVKQGLVKLPTGNGRAR